MKLLTQNTGWAATRNHLFWTTDNGRGWKDINPKAAAPKETISDVFFLDSSTGWVLLADGGNDQDRPRFDLASTTDAGGKWTLSRVKTSGLTPPEATLTGGGYMYFLDSTHGWINLSVASGSAFHPGAAMSTEDGGKTWAWVPTGSGSAGRIIFTDTRDGWILSPDQTELYATNDAARSWHEVLLDAPRSFVPKGSRGSGFGLPTFEDARHGFLMASFPDVDRLILFATADGGKTWGADRMLPHTEGASIKIEDSTWMAVTMPMDVSSLTLTTVSLRIAESLPDSVTADLSRTGALRFLHGADSVDFAGSSHGWVLAGDLLATFDAGATWTDITPSEAASVRPTPRPDAGAPP
jgi:photosystem II stability/assembly factor-like uncharacterized protein